MNDEQNKDSDPYVFEAEATSSAKLKAVWIVTAAIVVAGGLVAGTALALTKPSVPATSESPAGNLGSVPSHSDEPAESGEHFEHPDQHTVVIPPVAVRPKPKPHPTGVSSPLPSFGKKPHHEHENEDNEREESDD